MSPAYDLVSTALVIADDKEETALTINGKKSRLKKKDFDALAISMNINTKVLDSIYTKFEKALPKWIDFIKQSFLSKTMQKNYIELIETKYQNLFQSSLPSL